MINNKIKSRSELNVICLNLKKQGKTIGFTSGAFDFIHAGHVDYLEKAKTMCDVLIVGINSDKSVKKYKGENRPIINEIFRIKVIAAIESVDYVFKFEERRNHENIKQLLPDFYFKAGDYSSEQLTSKGIVEELGGTLQLIPVSENISTTSIINKISQVTGTVDDFHEDKKDVGHFDHRPEKSSPAIFLDRDGTINYDPGYLHEPHKFKFLPHAIDGIKKMYDMGYRLIIVTNQGGIGLGYFTKEDFYKVNSKMLGEISKVGVKIDKIYFCPHSFSDNCTCRKPNIDLLLRAKNDLNIDMEHSYFIGDSSVDVEAGKNAGSKTILIKGNIVKDIDSLKVKPDFVVNDLMEAANLILEEERKQ